MIDDPRLAALEHVLKELLGELRKLKVIGDDSVNLIGQKAVNAAKSPLSRGLERPAASRSAIGQRVADLIRDIAVDPQHREQWNPPKAMQDIRTELGRKR